MIVGAKHEDIVGVLFSVPFPNCNTLEAEGAYDVRHPEMAYVTASQVMIALEMSEGNLPDKIVFCDPLHITRIEPIDGAKAKRRPKRK